MKRAAYSFLSLCSLFLLFVLLSTGCESQKEVLKTQEDILFLSKGKLYKYQIASNASFPLFSENDSITRFYFSPQQRFIACEAYEQGSTQKNKLIIYDLTQRKKVRSIQPQSGSQLYVEKWVRPDVLFYSVRNGANAIPSYFTYKIPEQEPKDITANIRQIGSLQTTGFSQDGLMRAFVDSIFDIHLLHLSENKHKIIHQNTERVTDLCFSNNGKYLAWLNVSEKAGKIWDELFVYEVGKNKSHIIYREAAQIKNKANTMLFSPKKDFISIELNGKIYFIHLTDGFLFSMPGEHVCWIGKDQVAYVLQNELFFYNLASGNKQLIRKQVEQISQ